MKLASQLLFTATFYFGVLVITHLLLFMVDSLSIFFSLGNPEMSNFVSALTATGFGFTYLYLNETLFNEN